MNRLSVIIPAYNEERTLDALLQKIAKTNLPDTYGWEIIIIDDCSTDNTPQIITHWQNSSTLNVIGISHQKNYGKGHAIRTGLQHVSGRYTIIQDADLEYDPADIIILLQYAISHNLPVVYGSRILGQRIIKQKKKTASPYFYWGGRFVTFITNILYGLHLTDEPTCYKLFQTDLLLSIPLKCEQFEFCPEITAKVARRGISITELPIKYCPRSKAEGKKINWRDGLQAIQTLFRYRFCASKSI